MLFKKPFKLFSIFWVYVIDSYIFFFSFIFKKCIYSLNITLFPDFGLKHRLCNRTFDIFVNNASHSNFKWNWSQQSSHHICCIATFAVSIGNICQFFTFFFHLLKPLFLPIFIGIHLQHNIQYLFYYFLQFLLQKPHEKLNFQLILIIKFLN